MVEYISSAKDCQEEKLAVLEFPERRMQQVFQRAVTEAKIPPIRFHDLRHTFAVRLLQRGWDIATVGALLGHRAPYRTTMRYGAHTQEARKREALESLRGRQSQQVSDTQPHRANQSA
jgi:integrase